jgi:hypothetical protein
MTNGDAVALFNGSDGLFNGSDELFNGSDELFDGTRRPIIKVPPM